MSSISFELNGIIRVLTEENYDPISGDYVYKLISPNASSFPLSGHYYPAILSMTDDNGNELQLDDTDPTYGQYLRLRVREKVRPVVTLVSPEADQGKIVINTHSVTLVFTVTDLGGSGLDSVVLRFGDSEYDINDSELDVTVIENGYRIEFSPSVYLSDGDYPVSLTATDNDGNVTTLSLVIEADEASFKFIFDRTQEDVDRVRQLRDAIQSNTATALELLEYTQDLKGARNRSDFERILNATSYISTYYELALVISTLPELPTESYVNQMVDNIETIRNTCAIHNDTPLVPSLPINTYQKMNSLEKILYDVIQIIKSQFVYYCDAGLIMDGEIGLIE